jgi:hypothetical protein
MSLVPTVQAAARAASPSRRLSAAAMISLVAGSAAAGVNSWTNAAGGFWGDLNNWSLSVVPNAFDADAEISLAGAYTVSIQSAPTVGSLSLLNASADIAIVNGRSLTVNSDTAATALLTNDGLITVNSGQGSFSTRLGLGDADTAGILAAGPGLSGEVVLNLSDGNGDFNDAILTIAGGGEHAVGHTVRGKGRVAGLFVNNGLLLADRDGQELRISGAVAQGPTGVVSATNNGRLSVGESGSLSGGIFTSSTGGVLAFQAGLGTIGGGLHLMGDAEVSNGIDMNIATGGITNDGVFTINATQGSFFTRALVTDSTAILGAGSVDLNLSDANNDFNDAVLGTSAGITATNGPDHSVTGKGQLAGSWINDGTIEADRDGQNSASPRPSCRPQAGPSARPTTASSGSRTAAPSRAGASSPRRAAPSSPPPGSASSGAASTTSATWASATARRSRSARAASSTTAPSRSTATRASTPPTSGSTRASPSRARGGSTSTSAM